MLQDKEQFFDDLRKNYDNNNAQADRPKVQGYTPTYITQHSQQSQQQQPTQQQQNMTAAVAQGAAVSAANQQAVAVSELEDLPLTGDYHGLGDIHTIPEAAPGED